VAPHDKELSAFVADRFAEIEAFFYRSVKAAQAKGAVPRDRAAKDLSRLLLGIRVLARSKPDRPLLKGVARPVFALWIEFATRSRDR
jgi:TetR/AcrR family transcriptional regulator, transcriptional repressor for nem operon